MKHCRLLINKHPYQLRVQIADTWYSRLVGLLNRDAMGDHEALLLVPCSSIHTIGMRFSIDVVFLNERSQVIGIKEKVAPYRFCIAPKGTYKVLELPAGRAAQHGITTTSTLTFGQDKTTDEKDSSVSEQRLRSPR